MKLLSSIQVLALSLATTNLLSAGSTNPDTELTNALFKRFSQNPNIKELKIDVVEKQIIPNSRSWTGIKLKLSGKFNQNGNVVPFSENQIFFTDGENFSDNLTSLDGKDWNTLFTPQISSKHYDLKHLAFGNFNAPNKIVIFSDPLCPYCQRTVPALLDYVKKYPKTFAVFYYHLPLERIHPAAVTLTKLMYMAQVKGDKDAIIDGYSVDVDPRETDDMKILEAFNNATGLNYKKADVLNIIAVNEIEEDKKIANELEVRGTPTIYLNGEKTGGDFYKKVKIIE
jgi:predicted DsbA family dithiol-disulfide isomerase